MKNEIKGIELAFFHCVSNKILIGYFKFKG